MLNWFDADVMKYPRSVAVTWQASVNQLYPDGRALLDLLCWLASDPIPVALVRTGPKEPPHTPITSREKALKELSDYSLARWNADGSAVTVHRLVQDVTRARLTQPKRRRYLEDLIRVVDTLAPFHSDETRTWEMWAALRAHVLQITGNAEAHAFLEPIARLSNGIALYFKSNTQYAAAETQYRLAAHLTEAEFGILHSAYATVISNLAGVLQETNQLAEAEPLYRQSLHIRLRCTDPEHPSVGIAKSNLADLLLAEGKNEEALALFREARRSLHANSVTATPSSRGWRATSANACASSVAIVRPSRSFGSPLRFGKPKPTTRPSRSLPP